MSEREKKLILLLLGAAFLIINIFLYASYQEAVQRKLSQFNDGTKQLRQMEEDLADWDSQVKDQQWLQDNPPAAGTHGGVGADLANYTRNKANEVRVELKIPPTPQRENADEGGAYRSATVKVVANAMDRELYRWLTDLQDPAKARSVTLLRISPQRDDATRVDCTLEVTQWFSPESEEDAVINEQ